MAATTAARRGVGSLILVAIVLTGQLWAGAAWAFTDKTLAARLDRLWQAKPLRSAKVTALVADCISGRVLYERGAQQPLVPASNQKLPVTACALLLLGPDYRFRTRVLIGGPVREDGIVQGPIVVSGSVDPTADANIFVSLARALAQRKIRGCRGVWVDRALTACQDDSPTASRRRLIGALGQVGVDMVAGAEVVPVANAAEPVMEHSSAPLAEIIAQINKRSLNWLADNLFRSLGWLLAGDKSAAGKCLRLFWSRRGLPVANVEFADGSGLSRRNRMTAAFLVELLRYMYFCRTEWPAFAASLPGAGRDGTLATRMVGTPAQGRVWAKTGTMHDVCTLSGYAQTLSGRLVCFSILMNGLTCSQKVARDMADAAALAIVEAGGAPTEQSGQSVVAQPDPAASGFTAPGAY